MLTVIPYDNSFEEKWDKFVLEESINGSFLETRRFLNYHPKDRFRDASYIVLNEKSQLIAVCNACLVDSKEGPILVSHMGSTFGGILIRKKDYYLRSVLEIIKAAEDYLIGKGITEVCYKQPSNLFFSGKQGDLLDFAFYNLNYKELKDLNLYVNLNEYDNNFLCKFSQGKRTDVHNCQKLGMEIRKIQEKEDISVLYDILCETLEKYNKLPVHSLEELINLKDIYLKNECEFYAAYLNEEMVAGAMMFLFDNVSVAHAQYLCAKHKYDKLSPMTFMYYSMIIEMKKKGYHYLSWGIATEENGKYINHGLARSKENYGSDYVINRTFYKKLASIV